MLDRNNNGTAKILIVEDEHLIAEDLGFSLENLGYVVEGKVSNGKAAVDLAEKLRPDLILMDVKLQGDIDGIDAAEQIRKRLDIPVIFLTGYSERDVLERAKKTEPYGYIGKPVSLTELRNTIETAIYKHSSDKRMRESEQRYRGLIEQSMDGVVVVKGTIVLFANPAITSMLGIENEEELLGRSFLPFVAPEFREIMERRGFDREKGEDVIDFYEFMALRKDGTPFPAEIRAKLISYGGQKARQCIVRDITDQKKIEEDLRASKELFEKTFSSQRDGILILNGEKPPRILDCNPMASQIFGYSKQQMLGLTTAFLHVDESTLKKFRDILYSSIEENGFLHLDDFEMKRSDGRVFPTEHRVSELRDKQGSRVGWVSVIRDITDRKRSEEALLGSEERYRMLLETMNEAIGVQDAAGRITYVNDRLCELWGFSREELLGRGLEGFLDEENRIILRNQLASRKDGTSDRYEIVWTGKGGRKIHTLMSPRSLHDAEGNYIGSFAVLTDLTSWKQAQEELEVSLREKEVLLREVHHRVKNNLAVIQSLLRIQSRHFQNEELSQIVEDMLHRIRSMALGHELLYSSQSLSDIKISQYVGSLLTHLAGSYSVIGKKIAINQDIEESNLPIDTAFPLGFILTELVSNSYRYAFSDRRNGKISVSLMRTDDDHLELVVKDNGIGLKEEIDVSNPKSMGYHLIQIFVKQLRGELKIRRRKGTEVRVTFPSK